jgi:hypothetical protein
MQISDVINLRENELSSSGSFAGQSYTAIALIQQLYAEIKV